jgi:hypothetical protein
MFSLRSCKPFISLPYPLVRIAVKYGKNLINKGLSNFWQINGLVFFDKPFMFHEESIDELIVSRRYSNARAKKELKWEYVNFS